MQRIQKTVNIIGNLPTWFFLSVFFLASLTLNWTGTHASIDKSDIPSLLFDGVTDVQNLQTVMLDLRKEVYRDYKNISDNILLSAYNRVIPVNRFITVKLNGRTVSLASDLINDLRASLLLHPYDEINAIRALSEMHPAQFDFNPHIFQYGTIFVYMLGFTLWFAGKVGFYVFSPDIAYYLVHPDQIALLYTSGEMLVGLLTACGVVPLYYLVKLWRNRTAALSACFFYPLVPLFVTHSHRLKPHSLVVPFALLAVYLSLKAHLQKPTAKNYFIAGIFTGFCIGIIYTSLFVLPVLILSYWFNPDRNSAGRWTLWTGFIGVALGFFLFNPYYLLAPQESFQELAMLLNHHVGVTSFWTKTFHFFNFEMPAGMGWLPILMALMGMLVAFKQRCPGHGLLLTAAFLSMLGTLFNRGDAYYAAPTFALLLVWIGFFIDYFVFRPRPSGLAVVFLMVTVTFAVLQQNLYVSLFRQKEPSYAMGRWINQNIPKGSEIVRLEGWPHTYPVPFHIWDYKVGFPAISLPLDEKSVPDAIPPGSLTVESKIAPYVFIGCHRELPDHFTFENNLYTRVAYFRRSSRLEPFFRPDLMAWFTNKYYVFHKVNNP